MQGIRGRKLLLLDVFADFECTFESSIDIRDKNLILLGFEGEDRI